MKINFGSNNNYIQIERVLDKIYISLSAQDPKTLLSSVVNTVEIAPEEFISLVESVGIEIKR